MNGGGKNDEENSDPEGSRDVGYFGGRSCQLHDSQRYDETERAEETDTADRKSFAKERAELPFPGPGEETVPEVTTGGKTGRECSDEIASGVKGENARRTEMLRK